MVVGSHRAVRNTVATEAAEGQRGSGHLAEGPSACSGADTACLAPASPTVRGDSCCWGALDK